MAQWSDTFNGESPNCAWCQMFVQEKEYLPFFSRFNDSEGSQTYGDLVKATIQTEDWSDWDKTRVDHPPLTMPLDS